MSSTLKTIEIILELLDSKIALQRAKRAVADDHPIANAVDRAHAMGGELALIELKIDIQNMTAGLTEARKERA
jgi:hypothetical protein